MINLNELTVTNREFDLDNGFFWVEFDSGESLQCCLKELRQNEWDRADSGAIYVEQIELDNNGYSEGVCYDVNEWAENEDGEMGHVNDFLIEQARMIGLEIIA